jgi:hypothetical protein
VPTPPAQRLNPQAGWENGRVVRFRYNAAISVAAAVALVGAVPVATSRWYLAPLLLVPLAVGVWGWRAGTDANANGVRARALFGSRFLPWSRIDSLVVGDRNRVYARTTADSEVRLPAVSPADLPKLVAASGERYSGSA